MSVAMASAFGVRTNMEGAAFRTVARLAVSVPQCAYPTDVHLLLLFRAVGPVDGLAARALVAEPSTC